ncbi:Gfo/Idh/MocA family protein [Vibrio sp. SCSIO 43137]|uniref:Gfo/Idh/MocA family protein n=1 Tax=Vibrio sp. SCSIO 43137 TaxID=3021011 RepID=UPI0023070625|nr:Gfo/Idh/MocA family oxidoreductase [Vibrio sp. SCSIO 43137]WCE31897.1 Gfo/Idh/MocA family oxidoreductase [Vibrio sp. SCSIO 43137]
MANRKIKWGIAGLGNIAHRFAKDLSNHVDNGELYAVAARDQKRAEEFSREYGSKKSYGSYQLLAEDSSVEAVYIATIHPFHRKLVELFLSNGKHVLVEKPAFTNSKDWDDMSQLAAANNVLLVEAMKAVAFPAYRELRRFIIENDLKINSIEAAFGNWHEFDSDWHLFNPKLSGGATLDVGVYGLWLYTDLCSAMGVEVPKPSLSFLRDNETSQVDETVEFIFDGEVKGKIGASITRDLKREAIISGPDLEIKIHDKWWNPRTIDIKYAGLERQITTPSRGGGFEYETEHVCSLIIDNKQQSDILCSSTSRKVIAIMETALVEAGFEGLCHSDI